jgi:hypothetical protein
VVVNRATGDRLAVKIVKRGLVAALVACGGSVDAARGQSLTTEAAVSTGASTDDVVAAATQLRAFGDLPGGIRYYAEGAWARVSDSGSDAFGSAYPYRNRFQAIEAYGERVFRPGHAFVSARAGRYRTPFGIYNASDHAYTGFLRAPLIRYDNYFALSNNFLEQGADVVAGVPQLTVETSLGAPADVGAAVRRSGLDTVVHAQGFYGPVIAGVSYSRTLPYQPARFAHGYATFTGVDLRWMRNGVQLRGEWLTGQPFTGTTTSGWYADVIVHRVAMGALTAVGRVERLDYDTAPRFALHTRRQTIGARIRLLEGVSAQVNLHHTTGQLAADEHRPVALDLGVTYSIRRAYGATSR